MLKKIILVLFCLTICGCSFKTVQYSYEFSNFEKGLNFKKLDGNWLLNEMNLPEGEKGKLSKIAFKTFSNWTRNKVVERKNATDKEGKAIFSRISYDPSHEDLVFLNETTNYNYLINIYQGNSVNDSNSEESEIFIDIYDLSKKEIMLGERVIGFIDLNEGIDTCDDCFKVDVVPDITTKLLKKGLKKIQENSVF